MFEIYRYTESNQSLWDDFVPSANNGTLFHLRSFLNYHPKSRFVDNSLLINKKGKLKKLVNKEKYNLALERKIIHPLFQLLVIRMQENLPC